MRKKTKKRRQSHGNAWHWKQTDCWYFTMPRTKKRVALFDEQGQRVRGRAGETGDDLAVGPRAHLFRGGLEHGLAEGHLAVAGDHDLAALAYREDGRAVQGQIFGNGHGYPIWGMGARASSTRERVGADWRGAGEAGTRSI